MTLLFSSLMYGQVEVWNFNQYAIGADAQGTAICGESYMPEIILIGGQYFMYYGHKYNGDQDAISYATSNDMYNWTIQDTVIVGSADTNNREYVLGGPRVIELPNGQYRMFYRCCPKFQNGQEPKYHIRTAISSNGVNWSKEGIALEIYDYDANSLFSHVGHSEFYFDSMGQIRAFLTAKEAGSGNGPDHLYTAVSNDLGLNWTGFALLYQDMHDPVIVKDSSGVYHAYFSYLDIGFNTVKSSNGINWPSTLVDVHFIQGSDTLTEQFGTSNKIADLGAAIDPSGELIIYSNHAQTQGPWTNIAEFKSGSFSSLEPETKDFTFFPNPTKGTIYLNNANFKNGKVIIFNSDGKILHEQHYFNSKIDLSGISTGIYFLKVISEKGVSNTSKIVIL